MVQRYELGKSNLQSVLSVMIIIPPSWSYDHSSAHLHVIAVFYGHMIAICNLFVDFQQKNHGKAGYT